jgi:hypothetical protein
LRKLLLILLLASVRLGAQEIKLDLYYGNMAGWGSTTEAGLSFHKNGWFGTSRLAFIQSSGIGEDASNIGFNLGAGKQWNLSEHWHTGASMDVRFLDENINDLETPLLAPSIFVGYAWEIADYQLVLGFPYFFGVRAHFPLSI